MTQSDIIRRRITFYGEVQAVGFRYTAQHAAKLFGATGWVRNEYDGAVTMEIQGTRFQISQVLNELERDRYIRIERTESKDVPIEAKEKKFRVAYF